MRIGTPEARATGKNLLLFDATVCAESGIVQEVRLGSVNRVLLKNIELPKAENGYRRKDLQKSDIFRSLSLGYADTRQKLVRSLGIRSSTISAAVQELIDDDLVVETSSQSRGRRGRPETILAVNFDRVAGIALFVEDRAIIGAMTNLAGETIYEERREIDRLSGNDVFESEIVSLISSVRSHRSQGMKVVGTGISLIGTVDVKNRTWIDSGRWSRVQNLDLRCVEDRTELPLVLRRNLDSELEYQIHSNGDQPKERELLFHWGYGVGAAYAHNGSPLGSELGRFVDIGHARILPDSDNLCRCGRRGCLEADAAIYALVSKLRRRFPHLTEDSGQMSEVLSVPGVLEDPSVLRAVQGAELALAILCRVFYPQRIYLVGSFFANQEILRRMRTVIQSSPAIPPDQPVQCQIVDDSFRGCMHGNVYSLFQNRMQSLLRSRF